MNFDKLVAAGKFATHEAAIAYEFGYFIAHATGLAVVNADQKDAMNQVSRVPKATKVLPISLKDVDGFEIKPTSTVYEFANHRVELEGLHPKELGSSLQMVQSLMDYLDLPLDPKYHTLITPPGRSNIFKGKKGVTILDSTYNTGLGAMKAILGLFAQYPAKVKWLVLGDILEQGSLEKEEHQRLAKTVSQMTVDRIILLGPRTRKYTLPILKESLKIPIESFETPKEVLDYLTQNLTGKETVLFKGGRFLEGVIEQLLANPAEADQLVRREKAWIKRRQKWGLPR